MTGNSRIQSVDRALQIVLAVGQADGPVTLGELTALLGIDRSSVHRLAGTLKGRGFLAQDAVTKSYRLGPVIWQLAAQLRGSSPLLKVARSHVAWLAEATGETAHLAVRDGARVVLIDDQVTDQVVGVSANNGRTEPVHCTALGKALVADLDQASLEAVYDGQVMEGGTARSARSTKELFNHARMIRARGYAVDDEEFRAGVRCFAAPVRDFNGKIVAAIGISAPAARVPKRVWSERGEQVKAAGGAISRALGFVDQ
jgi:IclR family acetate operon transcriptional repressor